MKEQEVDETKNIKVVTVVYIRSNKSNGLLNKIQLHLCSGRGS